MGGFKKAVQKVAAKTIPSTLVTDDKPKSRARQLIEDNPIQATNRRARTPKPVKVAVVESSDVARALAKRRETPAAAAAARGYSRRERAFTSWSFSRYSAWYDCPLAAALSHLDKADKHLPKPPAMERGAMLDKETEDYIMRRKAKPHEELLPAIATLKQWRDVKPADKIVQDNWGYNAAWEPVSSTDWNNCKLRIKIDFGQKKDKGSHLDIWDAKTGKYREEQNDKYELQLDLYIAGAFAQLPTLQTATARLLYTDLDIIFPPPDSKLRVYTRAEAEKMQAAWDKRVKPMLADRSFKPKPSFRCRFCNFRKGGPVGGCKY